MKAEHFDEATIYFSDIVGFTTICASSTPIEVRTYQIYHLYDLHIKTMFGSSLPGRLMSYLRYLWLFAYSGVQRILCCVFVLFIFVLCTICCQFLWIVHF